MALIFQWQGNDVAPGALTTSSAGIGDTAPTQITLNGTTATIVSTSARTPAIQLQEAALGSSGWIDWNFSPSTTVAARVYFTPMSTLATTHAIFSLRGVSEARVADIILTSAGAVRVYDVANAFQTVGPNGTIIVGNTYRFEMLLDVVTGVCNIAIFPEHSLTPIISQNNVPGNFVATSIECFRLGKNTASPQAETQRWDDIVVTSDQQFIGPAVVVTTISAGDDQEQIEPFSTVTLNGSILTGSVSTWSWSQLSGPTVSLMGNGASRTFSAPASSENQTLEFQATGDSTAVDTVRVTVNPHLEWIKTSSGIHPLRPGR